PSGGGAGAFHPEQGPRLHGPERQPELVRDLRLRQAVEVHELDYLTLFGGETVEGGADGPAFLRESDLVDDVLGRVGLDHGVRESCLLRPPAVEFLRWHGV